ncbi:SPOR domain-containing protein [Bacillus sp. B15-48]|uniref:SPOR domain-containing protein n=1 Tax=Bacillus sp. B15-48 TaxID=1548601 RepID=UPI00193F6464|nr:SPOR domain-containing protein [Bacillus sp. B15-48]MBM4761389.1 hypothetical protein [Bacillus sp. B15-48]
MKTSAPLTKKPPDEKVLLRVQVGTFSSKKNGEELLEKIKKAGFEGYVKFE